MNHPAILVTGGTGFIGAYIIQELVKRNYTVRAIRRPSSRMPAFIPAVILEKVEWVEGDVLDIGALEDAMEGIDAIIHSAAVVSFHAEDRRRMYQTNIQGTANVVNLALQLGIKRMVYISSVAALGRSARGETVDETKTWAENRLNTHYAISKQQAEMEVWRGMAEGLEAVIVNPSTVLGYGDWNNSSSAIFKQAYHGFPWYTEGVNGFVAVQDVALMAVDLLESEYSMERYILNGENLSFREIFNTMATAFGKKPPHRKAGALLGQLAWRLEKIRSIISGKRPVLTKESAKVAQSKTYFSAKKVLEALPGRSFTPLKNVITESCIAYSKASAE